MKFWALREKKFGQFGAFYHQCRRLPAPPRNKIFMPESWPFRHIRNCTASAKYICFRSPPNESRVDSAVHNGQGPCSAAAAPAGAASARRPCPKRPRLRRTGPERRRRFGLVTQNRRSMPLLVQVHHPSGSLRPRAAAATTQLPTPPRPRRRGASRQAGRGRWPQRSLG